MVRDILSSYEEGDDEAFLTSKCVRVLLSFYFSCFVFIELRNRDFPDQNVKLTLSCHDLHEKVAI